MASSGDRNLGTAATKMQPSSRRENLIRVIRIIRGLTLRTLPLFCNSRFK